MFYSPRKSSQKTRFYSARGATYAFLHKKRRRVTTASRAAIFLSPMDSVCNTRKLNLKMSEFIASLLIKVENLRKI